MEIKISEIEESLNDLFGEEGKVRSIKTVYEKSEDGKFYKLIVSLHELLTDDILIIHTKFIFKTDLEKHNITDNSFMYLYDINCIYHKVDFENIIDMKKKIQDIIDSANFSETIKILSDFTESPAMFLNYYMRRANITDYSIFDVKYDPKFPIVSCDKITFDFEININNNYTIELSISKKHKKEDDDINIFKFVFKFLDNYETVETDTLKNIHYTIGSTIAKLLDTKLK
jgi:hypothetical protein